MRPGLFRHGRAALILIFFVGLIICPLSVLSESEAVSSKSQHISTPCDSGCRNFLWIFHHHLGEVSHDAILAERSTTSLNTPEQTPGFLQGTWLSLQPAQNLSLNIQSHWSKYSDSEVLTWFGMHLPLAGRVQKKGSEPNPRCDIWGLPLWHLRKIVHTFKWFRMLQLLLVLAWLGRSSARPYQLISNWWCSCLPQCWNKLCNFNTYDHWHSIAVLSSCNNGL